MTLLDIDAVSKSFGNHHALREVSLAIKPGEFLSLLGPSGCGKTTLLRLIAGFMQPDLGRISIAGQDVTALPPHRRPLNTVFQNYALFPHLTVIENVAYGPRRAGVAREEAARRAREALDLVGLRALHDRYPRQMSGGQQQRVALARAIVNRPKLLLLDEPLSALDLQLRKRMQIELKQLQEKLGVAFVFVTHDQEEAMAMSDRIAVMNAGRIEQLGGGADIYRFPQTRFVAEFIGEATLLPVATGSGALTVVPAEQTPPSGQQVAVVRPEHVLVRTDGGQGAGSGSDSDGSLQVGGHVEALTRIGGATNIYVRALGHLVHARRLGLVEEDMAEGQPVDIVLRRQDLHLLAEPGS